MRWDGLLADVEPRLRDAVLGAVRGSVVGPVVVDAGHAVAVVDEKTDPTAADPVVLERAIEVLRRRALEDAVVRWVSRR